MYRAKAMVFFLNWETTTIEAKQRGSEASRPTVLAIIHTKSHTFIQSIPSAYTYTQSANIILLPALARVHFTKPQSLLAFYLHLYTFHHKNDSSYDGRQWIRQIKRSEKPYREWTKFPKERNEERPTHDATERMRRWRCQYFRVLIHGSTLEFVYLHWNEHTNVYWKMNFSFFAVSPSAAVSCYCCFFFFFLFLVMLLVWMLMQKKNFTNYFPIDEFCSF